MIISQDFKEAVFMEKYITDERTGLKYELVGDYYIIAETMSRRKNRSQSGYGDSDIFAI